MTRGTRLHRAANRAALSRPAAVAFRAVGVETLVCLGDSHLRPMVAVRKQRMLPRTFLRVVSVRGATASGIDNPRSVTQARTRFLAETQRLRSDSAVLTSLGEVDIGYRIYLRQAADGSDPADLADSAYSRYVDFLTAEVLSRGARLLVLSVIPPTVDDYRTWDGRSNDRGTIRTSWAERAEMVAGWNGRLSDWCEQVGAEFLDMTPRVTVAGTMRVRPEWLSPREYDQHLHPDRQARLFAELLAEHGFR